MSIDAGKDKAPNVHTSMGEPSDRPVKRLRHESSAGSGLELTTPEDELQEKDLIIPKEEHDVVKEDQDKSGLDSSLPSIHESEAAIEEELKKSGKYTSSLYTDAFNLALDTVLEEESHLFSEEEAEVFAKYRSLPYEAQYLFVRLFLRKTAAWFRISRLGYHSDIGDMPIACSTLWSPDVRFAESESSVTDLDEAASLLCLDELKALAKEEKFTGTNKSQLLAGLKRASEQQGRLDTRGKGQLTLSFDGRGRYSNRNQYHIRKILDLTGPCIRLISSIVTLFERVHLVFYRSTEWTEKSLKTLILARTLKRNFPEYIVSRTANIFATRLALVEFEEAIKLQAIVDETLENSGVPSQDGLKKVLEIFESIWDRWNELVEEERARTNSHQQEPDYLTERIYLRRFSAAWVLTRIVHKGVYILGRFKSYSREHAVLTALLEQRFYHGARRGGWYQRKALIEEHYLASPPDSEIERRKWRRIALETCERGLQDPESHVIFHYDLQKRVMKLEQKLKVPKKDQHEFTHTKLLKPLERTVTGTRLSETGIGRKTIWVDPYPTSEPELDLNPDSSKQLQQPPKPKSEVKECSVEEMCLSHYRRLGWKGYHCEGSLLRTLFAYLFHDILFLYVPNVFETSYQTCPLDLFTDAFYPTRASEINHRLVAITNGEARRILQEVYDKESSRQTCVVGLDWGFSIEDLREIVDCISGEALAMICKVMCQEYRQRGGGLPDLFLWNYEKRECMFVEVKSENDRLSDTQRLWIHVLSSVGVRVELCKAVNVGKKVEEQ